MAGRFKSLFLSQDHLIFTARDAGRVETVDDGDFHTASLSCSGYLVAGMITDRRPISFGHGAKTHRHNGWDGISRAGTGQEVIDA